MSLTVEVCSAIADAWIADARCWAIESTIRESGAGYVHFNMFVRAWLARTNSMANDALWDGHRGRAINLMRQHGFRDNRGVDRPDRHKENLISTQTTLTNKAYKTQLERGARRAWNVCK